MKKLMMALVLVGCSSSSSPDAPGASGDGGPSGDAGKVASSDIACQYDEKNTTYIDGDAVTTTASRCANTPCKDLSPPSGSAESIGGTVISSSTSYENRVTIFGSCEHPKPVTCDAYAMKDACTACLAKENCPALYRCENERSCAAIYDCADACTDAACTTACGKLGTSEDGWANLTSLVSTSKSSCQTACQ